MQVTRRLEFDAGHRIPDHKSQCRHMHGHRYALEITLSGEVLLQEGASSNGMVMDFSDIKDLAKRHFVDKLDHSFIAYSGDTVLMDFLRTMPEHKTVILDSIPTAENLVKYAFDVLDKVYKDSFGRQLRLERVRLYETPNCWAEIVRDG